MPVPEAVDMNQLLATEQAQCMATVARGFGSQMTRLQVMADDKFDSVGFKEAQASSQLGKAGENPRYQPQSTPAAI